jgi:hypothetical protein
MIVQMGSLNMILQENVETVIAHVKLVTKDQIT